MTIEQKIINALKGIGLPVVPEPYTGDALEYLTFSYDLFGSLFAEGKPGTILYDISLHHYAPFNSNPGATRIKICTALSAAGFAWPSITNASDNEGQHWVFEFSGKE